MQFLKLQRSIDFLNAARIMSRRNPMSIRQLGGKLGYSSDRAVGMVLKGQRPMSSEMQMRVAKLLKLTPKEQVHLQVLVRRERLGQGGSSMPPAAGFETGLRSTCLTGNKLHPLIPAFSLVVLELLRIEARSFSVADLKNRLRQSVSPAELEDGLRAMREAGLINADENGYIRALDENEFVTTSFDIPSAAIREIHRRQLARAVEALDEQSTVEREFVAKTITVSRAKIAELKRLFREKLEEMAEEAAQCPPPGDAVVAQLNVQFYLQSK